MTDEENILDQLGITELDLAEMMARAARRRILLIHVPLGVYTKAEEIRGALRSCQISQEEAEARWEFEVFPHLGIRPGPDYDPKTDTIQLRVKHVERLFQTH